MTTRLPFHEQLRHEREMRGWSQADLAEKVGCDTKTIGRWERGNGIPRPYYRQVLCELLGKNAEELGLVGENLARAQPSSSLSNNSQSAGASLFPTPSAAPSQSPISGEELTSDQPAPSLMREDWGEAPYVVNLYGREEEYSRLAHWIEEHQCRVVAILGMGGVGKTAVTAKIARQIGQDFEYVFWRSLQNAPPPETFLKQCISFVSNSQHVDLPGEVDDQLSLLIHALRDHCCLLVLDNFESVLQPGRRAGQYREGYAAYGRLLQRMGEAQHTSCLLVTSREKPKEVAQLEGNNRQVRSLRLSGLGLEAGQQMLQDKELIGSDAHWSALVERYSGNPLALQVVSESISEVFEGKIGRFLEEEAIAFGDINDLLDQQFQRLSAQEQEILYWLAIEREPVSLEDLRANLGNPMSIGTQLEALDSLRRRSLIETRGLAQFTLQPVILEFVTMSLVERACQEFDTEAPQVWIQFALCKAQAKDYVRDSQVRLLLAPIAQRLLVRSGKEGVEQGARNMLASQRQMYAQQPGYLAGNILNLLSYLHCDLRGFDLSHLVIRQAYLQDVMLHEVNFAHAHFISSIFSNTFGNILAVACSPREQGQPQEFVPVAAGTSTGEILIYDALSGVLRLTCSGHTDGVWSLAFSPNGSLFASGSDDANVRLWDSASGECLRILRDHTNRVRTVAFSPGGGTLASGSDDATIRLWDVHSGRCLQTLAGHTDRVWSLAYSPDGKLLASGSTDRSVRLWDTETGSCLATLQGHSDWIRSVAFDAEGDVLASGSDDQAIRLWKVATGEHLLTLTGHTSRIWSVAFHPAKGILASGSEDSTIRLWDIATGHGIMLLQGHRAGVRSVTFTVERDMLISGGDDQTIRVWDVSSGNCLRTMQGHTNRVWCIAFHPDGNMLASASEDAAIRLWDVKSGRCLKLWQDSSYDAGSASLRVKKGWGVGARFIAPRVGPSPNSPQRMQSHDALTVAFHPRGSTIASGGQDQAVRVWDAHTGQCLHILRGHTNWVRAVTFSPGGNLLASGSEDATIRIWDINSGACLCILRGHSSWVRSLAFSPDGSLLASGADDSTIRLWNATSGLHLKTLEGHTGRVRTITFSPAGNLLASGSEDATIRIWDIHTGHCLFTLQGISGRIRSIAFSPGGDLLASGGEDATIRLWDIHTRQCIRALRGHANRVRWVTFSPGGHTLASSSDDGTIRCWDLHSYDCLNTLIAERPYEHMNISYVQGLTEAQKANLRALGAIEEG